VKSDQRHSDRQNPLPYPRLAETSFLLTDSIQL
jgi:hypothetical protein